MPRRSRVQTVARGYGARRRRRRVVGGNIFKKMWSGIKKGFNWAKDNKVLSTALGVIPGAQNAATVARAVGLGRRRRRRGVTRGGRQMRTGNHVLVY